MPSSTGWGQARASTRFARTRSSAVTTWRATRGGQRFGPRAASEFGFASLLACRLSFDSTVEHDDMIAAINVFGDRPSAFDDADRMIGVLLSTHAGIALVAATERERSQQLLEARDSNWVLDERNRQSVRGRWPRTAGARTTRSTRWSEPYHP